jgi:hypothetical protein
LGLAEDDGPAATAAIAATEDDEAGSFVPFAAGVTFAASATEAAAGEAPVGVECVKQHILFEHLS